MSEGRALSLGSPHVFTLVDMTRIGAISPEARAIAKEWTKGIEVAAAAVFGASFHFRVVATLVQKASTLFDRGPGYPLCFFDTEAEARAWLAEQRRLFLAKRA